MRSTEQHVPGPPVRWRLAVCVLGLLAGLFGMHGLAPAGGLPEPSAGHPQAAAAHPGETHAGEVHAGCPQGDGACGGGHLQHADAVCASGAVSDGPVLPAPVPDPVPLVGCDGTVRVRPVDAPDGARAPPSLAELQLLRI
ncbi:hypothetical protein RKD29_002261 [Streptomyces tendae]|uniref:DUF6153 family protein n=1 Tax=Streptomyces tendae TaxID=1932 RepID=UPI0038335598